MKKLVVGNWKLYINSPRDAKKLFVAIDKKLPKKINALVALCPQVSLAPLVKAGYRGRRIALGTQDVSVETEGAHTGSISPKSLSESGLQYVIVGHAEKRAQGDTDEIVSKKAASAISAKLHPIICIGEAERDIEGNHFTYIAESVMASLERLDPKDASRFTIAYEPVWAIGAPMAPNARLVGEATMFIRKTLVEMWGRETAQKVRIIYGGSVNAANAKEFADSGSTQGFLLGRASIEPAEFISIVNAFSK